MQTAPDTVTTATTTQVLSMPAPHNPTLLRDPAAAPDAHGRVLLTLFCSPDFIRDACARSLSLLAATRAAVLKSTHPECSLTDGIIFKQTKRAARRQNSPPRAIIRQKGWVVQCTHNLCQCRASACARQGVLWSVAD